MDAELEQQIRERAYEIWEFRQENNMRLTLDRLGNLREVTAEENWLEAEREILYEAKNKN